MSTTILTADSAQSMEPTELLVALLDAPEDSDFAAAARRQLIDVELFTMRDIEEELDRIYDERRAHRAQTKREYYIDMLAEADCHDRRNG